MPTGHLYEEAEEPVQCACHQQVHPSQQLPGKLLGGVPSPLNCSLDDDQKISKGDTDYYLNTSKIFQGDANDTISTNDTSSVSDDDTDFDTDDELDPEPIPANLSPVAGQIFTPGKPIELDVNLMQNNHKSSNLPLCIMLNSRSLYNKIENFRELLYQIGPSIALVSETWERKRKQIKDILESTQFKSISYFRGQNRPGGGCAIIYNESKFNVSRLDIEVAENVEAAWALFTPKLKLSMAKVKRIAVGTFYVSPNSRHKAATLDHIIETIHQLRAKYDNEVNFLLGGDFNRLKIDCVLDAYGALKQICTVPTRQSATLEIILTDLHTLYHPPTTLPPLEVDPDKNGVNSDHNIVVMAPLNNEQYRIDRVKKVIKTRPLPESKIFEFENDIICQDLAGVWQTDDIDGKVRTFDTVIRNALDKHFPEKSIKVSALDKKWMTPNLKQLHRKVQREFFRNRKSAKWKRLKLKFKKLKRKTIKSFHSKFVSELKTTNPGKWYSMAKRLGAVDQMNGGDTIVESLSNLSNFQAAQKIAEHFSAVSNEYSPVDHTQLPSYLPAPAPPQVEEYTVYEKIKYLKKTKSTLPTDIPDKLRRACAAELAGPLTHIINECLIRSHYPQLWKHEWVSPAPKITHPKVIKDLRKISCTSDYSKIFERFLKEWIIEDIFHSIDIGQFGGLKGTGTEHMLVCMLDRILKLLDKYPDKSAVIAASLDWTAAFDRQDPTLAIKKFLEMGVRPAIIPLLISYLTDRKMSVKFNGVESDVLGLIGGGPQGTLLGQIEYIVQSNDNADIVSEEDRFKYIDDLTIVQLVSLSGLLTDYNFTEHVASDIGVDQLYLPADSYPTQNNLNGISNWTEANLMKLNESKCYYMVFSRTNQDFATRLRLNDTNLDRKSVTKILGVWLSEDLSWARNVKETCIKAYSRLSMLTKLKYVGVSYEDLIEIYIMFIRSITEYCSVVFHSGLTQAQSDDLERIQRTCLKVILAENYVSYEAALKLCGLQTLFDRRQKRCLDFALKCLKHPVNSRLFPSNVNKLNNVYDPRKREHYQVNFARTSAYRDSSIPYCQRLLNRHFQNQKL